METKLLKVFAENWQRHKAAPTKKVLTILAAVQTTALPFAMPKTNTRSPLKPDTSAGADVMKIQVGFKKILASLVKSLLSSMPLKQDVPARLNIKNVILDRKSEQILVPKTALPNMTTVKIVKISEPTLLARPVIPALLKTVPINITLPDVPPDIPIFRIVRGNANS